MNSSATELIVVIACIIGIVVGGIYIVEHMPAVHCFNWFGLAKGCVVSK